MQKTNINLVPKIQNPTPDYYCTWQTQLYATSDGKPVGQRAIIDENSLFNPQKPYGWAYFFPQARGDLILIMDDSWDVPPNNDKAYFGSLILNAEKFPQATKNGVSNAQALKNLTQRIKSLGWKGLGCWICAGESKLASEGMTQEAFWINRIKQANEAGITQWKVDWGRHGKEGGFRQMLTDLAKKEAPELILNHAMTLEIAPTSDVYRTYDVPEVMSVPMKIEKLIEVLTAGKAQDGYMGLIDCEDEVYMAAAGGFVMGIMRHPYSGAFPNGKADMSFPAAHRDVKTKMYEVIRGTRWHRIAPAFGIDTEQTYIDTHTLSDTWHFEDWDAELEAWWLKTADFEGQIKNDSITKSAAARIARNCAPPTAVPDENGNVPYIIAAHNPNGAFSLVTLGRTQQRAYFIPKCDITAHIGEADTVGVFGEYKTLILKTQKHQINAVYMQDLAADNAMDITEDVQISGGQIRIPGALIHQIGTWAQPACDTSEPGVVIQIK